MKSKILWLYHSYAVQCNNNRTLWHVCSSYISGGICSCNNLCKQPTSKIR